MRITLLGHPDIASLIAMDRIMRLLPEHEFTVRMSSGAFNSARPAPAQLERLDAAEAKLGLRFLAGEFGRAPDARLELTPESTLDRPNAPDGLDALAATSPDLVVSVRYHRILQPEAISIPRHGVINLHSGLLPEYRGVMATFWSMLHGCTHYGTTIHRIVDAGIDSGPALARLEVPLDCTRSYFANVLSLYPPSCDRLAALIERIDRGDDPQPLVTAGSGAYFTLPSNTDFDAFSRKGLRLFSQQDEETVVLCATTSHSI